jgi:hypothetical protein
MPNDLQKISVGCLECYVVHRNKKAKQNEDTIQLELRTVTEYDYPRILNNILPLSIRVLVWCTVSPEFSARFSCSTLELPILFPGCNLDLMMSSGLCKVIGKHYFTRNPANPSYDMNSEKAWGSVLGDVTHYW